MAASTYIAIDLKSFSASAECADKRLYLLATNLVAADESRTENTICLAVSPSLKACGIHHGALPPKQTVKGFFEGVSVPVNPDLSTIFLQLHISERTGRGIPKIINAYDRGIFEFGENTISVILPYNRLEVEAQTPQVEGQTLPVGTPVNAQVGNLTPQVDAQVKGATPQVKGATPQVDADKGIFKRTKKRLSTQHLQSVILVFCAIPRSVAEIMTHLSLRNRKDVRERCISPLIEQGRLAMTIPQSPNSRFQKYITIK